MSTLSLWLALVLLFASGLSAQPGGSPTPSPSATDSNPAPTPILSDATPLPTPYGLADMAAELESARTQIKEIESNLSQDSTPKDIDTGLSALGTEVARLLPITKLKLAQDPSPSELRDLEAEWKLLAKPIPIWRKRLNERASDLDAALSALAKLNGNWEAAQKMDLPAELIDEMGKLVVRMNAAREQIRADRDKMLVALDRLNSAEHDIESTQKTISEARAELVKQIFVQDRQPIWNEDFSQLSGPSLALSALESWDNQRDELARYFSRNIERFLFHLLCLGLFYLCLNWAGKRVRPWVEIEPSLQRPAQAFCSPVASGLLLAYLLSPWIYSQQPPMLQTLLAATALFPASLVLSRLLDAYYHTALKMAIFIFIVDRVREVSEPQILLSRLILTGEMTLLVLYLAWRIVAAPRASAAPWARPLVACFFAFAWVMLNLGFVNLGTLVGKAALQSAYLAILLLALVQILDGMILLALRTPPLSLFASVRNHRPLYREHLRQTARKLAKLLWILVFLDYLSLLTPVLSWVSQVLSASAHLGALSLSLGGIITVCLSLVIPYQLSRLVRFQLEQDLYPKLSMSLGQTYTISMLIHYIILFTGALVGLAAVGVDTTKFAVVAGALSVGIGFGLQNVVNNFVSGLILLFERPIEVGHVIEVTGQVGTLQRIGLRASVLRTADGSEVIVPNGELLSTKVTNWTLSDQRRLLRVDVSVSYDSSPSQVQELLLQVAVQHPDVCHDPAPQVVMLALADSAMNMQLQAWTEKATAWMAIRSDLLIGALESLRQAGIEIPFPQRVVHLLSPDKSADEVP